MNRKVITFVVVMVVVIGGLGLLLSPRGESATPESRVEQELGWENVNCETQSLYSSSEEEVLICYGRTGAGDTDVGTGVYACTEVEVRKDEIDVDTVYEQSCR